MTQTPGSILASTYLPPAQANTFATLEQWYYEVGAHPIYRSLGFGDEEFYAIVYALNTDAVTVDDAGRYACRELPVLDLFARIGRLPEPHRIRMQELIARYAAIFRELPGEGSIPWAPTSRHVRPSPAAARPFDEGIFRIHPELRPFEAALRAAGVDGIALIRMRLLAFFNHQSLGMHPELVKLLGKVSGLPQPAVEILRRSIGK
jgi:hypothetical protein